MRRAFAVVVMLGSVGSASAVELTAGDVVAIGWDPSSLPVASELVQIDAETGDLRVEPARFGLGMRAEPRGTLVSGGVHSIYRFDPADGSLQTIELIRGDLQLGQVAVRDVLPCGELVLEDVVLRERILGADPDSGLLRTITEGGFLSGGAEEIYVDLGGRLYFVNADLLYEVDPESGAQTFVSAIPQTHTGSIAILPDGETGFAATLPEEYFATGLAKFDVATGAGQEFEPTLHRIATTPDGRLFALQGRNFPSLVEVNVTTGETTPIPEAAGLSMMSLDVVPAPEPDGRAVALLVLGSLGARMAWNRRRPQLRFHGTSPGR